MTPASDANGPGSDSGSNAKPVAAPDGGSLIGGNDPTTDPPLTTTPEPPVPPKVANCAGLAEVGVFEDITPPEVRSQIQPGSGGTFAVATDPVNLGTVYAGTVRMKLWKSTDCGSTWQHISTGRNGDLLDSGMNWSLVVDPQQPEVIYSASGYGGNGLFKSENGGVDWDRAWPPPAQPELAKAFTYNFANVLALDPTNHNHLLLTYHEECLPPHPKTCISESFDGGDTWRLIDGRSEWSGNEGQVIFFMDNSATWLWGSSTNGYWRTENSGKAWTQIPNMTTTHRQGAQLYRAPNGAYYVSGSDGIWRSADGKVSTWTLVPNTGPHNGGLIGSDTTLYGVSCYAYGFGTPRYFTSPITDGKNWTVMSSPTLVEGGTFAYDPGHHLLYSSNLSAGMFRIHVR